MGKRPAGFSLIEVVAAVAVTAVGLAVVLALLTSLGARAADSRERLVACGLADAITVALRDQIFRRGYDSVVAEAASAEGIQFTADQAGHSIRPSPGNRAADDHFLIVARRIDTGALAYRREVPMLPLQVVVAWPFRTVRGDEVAGSAQERVTFVIGLNR